MNNRVAPAPTASESPDVLVVDDSPANRRLCEALLRSEGLVVRSEESGDAALPWLQRQTRPMVALIDWEMPGRSGPEIIRELRHGPNAHTHFLILLTARTGRDDIVAGLKAGANDYVTKPFNPAELIARVRIGRDMVLLQRSLADRVAELERALMENRQLKGLLPICSYCKNVRDEANYWQQVESYVASRTEAEFSHGICPDCVQKHFGDLIDAPATPASGAAPAATATAG